MRLNLKDIINTKLIDSLEQQPHSSSPPQPPQPVAPPLTQGLFSGTNTAGVLSQSSFNKPYLSLGGTNSTDIKRKVESPENYRFNYKQAVIDMQKEREAKRYQEKARKYKG